MATHPTHEPPKGPHMAAPQTAAPKAAPAPEDAPSRPQMELGGSGTAKASFKDAAGGDVKIDSSVWSATGGVKVTADDKDPTSAKIEPTEIGPAMITVTATTADGSAETSQDLMVTEKVGKPVSGTIDIAVQAPTKAK